MTHTLFSAAVSPDGAHVYVTSRGGVGVVAFSRNAGTGALTFLESIHDGRGNDGGIRTSVGGPRPAAERGS